MGSPRPLSQSGQSGQSGNMQIDSIGPISKAAWALINDYVNTYYAKNFDQFCNDELRKDPRHVRQALKNLDQLANNLEVTLTNNVNDLNREDGKEEIDQPLVVRVTSTSISLELLEGIQRFFHSNKDFFKNQSNELNIVLSAFAMIEAKISEGLSDDEIDNEIDNDDGLRSDEDTDDDSEHEQIKGSVSKQTLLNTANPSSSPKLLNYIGIELTKTVKKTAAPAKLDSRAQAVRLYFNMEDSMWFRYVKKFYELRSGPRDVNFIDPHLFEKRMSSWFIFIRNLQLFCDCFKIDPANSAILDRHIQALRIEIDELLVGLKETYDKEIDVDQRMEAAFKDPQCWPEVANAHLRKPTGVPTVLQNDPALSGDLYQTMQGIAKNMNKHGPHTPATKEFIHFVKLNRKGISSLSQEIKLAKNTFNPSSWPKQRLDNLQNNLLPLLLPKIKTCCERLKEDSGVQSVIKIIDDALPSLEQALALAQAKVLAQAKEATPSQSGLYRYRPYERDDHSTSAQKKLGPK